MKKLMLFVLVAALAGSGCSKDDPISEYRAFFGDMATQIETLGAALEKAKSGKDAAAAINAYSEKLSPMKKRGDELDKKYPEFKKSEEPPAELKDEMNKLGEAINRNSKAMMEAMKKYSLDKDFQEALAKMRKV
jgi:hypothetical protein